MHHRVFVESERRRRSLCGDDGTGLVFSCRGLLDAFLLLGSLFKLELSGLHAGG